jgi:hypothetical protein
MTADKGKNTEDFHRVHKGGSFNERGGGPGFSRRGGPGTPLGHIPRPPSSYFFSTSVTLGLPSLQGQLAHLQSVHVHFPSFSHAQPKNLKNERSECSMFY